MEPEKEKAHNEAMKHMKRATEHLRESVAVHEAEVAGTLTHEQALPMAVALNAMAAEESDLAAAAIRDFLGDETNFAPEN